MEIMNQVRGYAYLFGVLKNQQADPFCRSCNSFVKTLAAVRENLATFEARHAGEIRNFRTSDPPPLHNPHVADMSFLLSAILFIKQLMEKICRIMRKVTFFVPCGAIANIKVMKSS
jgi:hypothetical protein